MRFSKTRELWNYKWTEILLLNFIQPQLPFGVSPTWAQTGWQEGTATRRDAHGKAITLLACSCPIATPYCRCGMCSLSSGSSHAGASLPWFWPLFPVCTSVISQQTKVPADSTQESVMQFLGPPNPTKPMADYTGLSWKSFTCQLMENICTTPYAIFRNIILRNHPVKIRLKKNKITVVTIQFSSQPIYPPSLLFSRQYFIIQCTKRRKKNVNKKNDLLGGQFIPHFPYSTIWLLFEHVSQPEFCTPIAPKSWRAIERRKREKIYIPAAAAKNWAMNPSEKLEDTEEQGAVCYIDSGFGSAAQKCTQQQSSLSFWTEIIK